MIFKQISKIVNISTNIGKYLPFKMFISSLLNLINFLESHNKLRFANCIIIRSVILLRYGSISSSSDTDNLSKISLKKKTSLIPIS